MFSPLSMGTNFMFGVDNYVPIMNNNFEIRIYNSDGSSPTENTDLLTLSTSEIGEIQEEQDVITVHYGNGIIKFPAKVTFADVDWTLNCYCKPNCLEALREWRSKVFDPNTERMGLPSQYMRTVYFVRYTADGRETVDVIKCPGTWIKGLKNGSMNQEGGIVNISVTLVISKAIYLSADQLS